MSSREKIQRIPHPIYNPDLAPRDFFLFGSTKRQLTQYDIPDRQTLKTAGGDAATMMPGQRGGNRWDAIVAVERNGESETGSAAGDVAIGTANTKIAFSSLEAINHQQSHHPQTKSPHCGDWDRADYVSGSPF
jgi:hypothetical protein